VFAFVNSDMDVRMAAGRFWFGYPWVSGSAVLVLVVVFRPRFSGSGPRNRSGLALYPWISKLNHLELKFIFYNI